MNEDNRISDMNEEENNNKYEEIMLHKYRNLQMVEIDFNLYFKDDKGQKYIDIRDEDNYITFVEVTVYGMLVIPALRRKEAIVKIITVGDLSYLKKRQLKEMFKEAFDYLENEQDYEKCSVIKKIEEGFHKRSKTY